MEPLLYGEVKGILARTLGISVRKTGVFKGQLDHLRKLGVPSIRNTGSGRKARYAFADAFELLIALRLERLNCPPKWAKVGAGLARKEIGTAMKYANWYLVCDPDADGGFVPGDSEFVASMTEQLDQLIIVNLSRSAKDLNSAWQAEVEKAR